MLQRLETGSGRRLGTDSLTQLLLSNCCLLFLIFMLILAQARDENNMHIASLESSLKRRQALKIELDNRDKRVKRYRSRVLANRDTNSEHRDSNTGGGTGNG